MSRRNNVKKTYLSDAEAKHLSEWADEVDKSESALLREAVLEYLDHDRTARIEEKIDRIESKLDAMHPQEESDTAHTHKPQQAMSASSSVAENKRDIIHRLQENNGEVMKDEVVVRAIEDIAGYDDRTIAKYKNIFRKRGLLFEHPGESPVWTTDSDQWLEWMSSYVQLNGRDEAEVVADQYPAQIFLGTDEKLHVELTEVAE